DLPHQRAARPRRAVARRALPAVRLSRANDEVRSCGHAPPRDHARQLRARRDDAPRPCGHPAAALRAHRRDLLHRGRGEDGLAAAAPRDASRNEAECESRDECDRLDRDDGNARHGALLSLAHPRARRRARMTAIGLAGIALGAFAQSLMPAAFGVAGYILPIIVMTSHYALFQTANNTAIMSGVRGDQRGVISGMLSLSRNAGLITGAAVMGAVFAATGLRVTYAIAGTLIAAALSSYAFLAATRSRTLGWRGTLRAEKTSDCRLN